MGQAPQFVILTGKMLTLSSTRTGSAIIQSCLKHGDQEVWNAIAKELIKRIRVMARGRYSHQIVPKMFKYCRDKGGVRKMMRQLLGRTPSLLRHVYGSRVIDEAYFYANIREKRTMMSEFYGEPVDEAIFTAKNPGLPRLREIFGKNSTEYGRMCRSVYFKLTEIWEKVSSPEELNELCAAISKNCLVASPVKLRQATLELRGQVVSVASHHAASMVLLALLKHGSINERHLRRALLPEMIKGLDEILDSAAGQRFMCTLLSGNTTRYLQPIASSFMEMDARSAAARNVELGHEERLHYEEKEEEGLVNAVDDMADKFAMGNSDSDERRACMSTSDPWDAFLMKGAKGDLEAALISYCLDNLRSLICSGTDARNLLFEVLRRGGGGSNSTKPCSERAQQQPRQDGHHGVQPECEDEGAAAAAAAVAAHTPTKDAAGVIQKSLSSSMRQPRHRDLTAAIVALVDQGCKRADEGETENAEKCYGGILSDYYGSRNLRRIVLSCPSSLIPGGLNDQLWTVVQPRKDKIRSSYGRRVLEALMSVRGKHT
eukprot:jgi/Bigna1/81219/fgenesh1_pg.78_\